MVSKKGVVTFTGIGETTVTAVCGDDPEVTASVTVRALQLADEVAFDSLGYTVSLGGSAQLYASVLPADTADPSLTYKSADPSVAAVDENGVVTGVSAGRRPCTPPPPTAAQARFDDRHGRGAGDGRRLSL